MSSRLPLPLSWWPDSSLDTEATLDLSVQVCCASSIAAASLLTFWRPRFAFAHTSALHLFSALVSCLSDSPSVSARVRAAAGVSAFALALSAAAAVRHPAWSRKERAYYAVTFSSCAAAVLYYSFVSYLECLHYLTIALAQSLLLFMLGFVIFLSTIF